MLVGGWERQGPHEDKQGNSNPWGSRPRRFCESQPRSERSKRSAPTWSRWSTLKNPYQPRESKWSKGTAGGPEVVVIGKSQAVVGGTLGEGVEGTQAV